MTIETTIESIPSCERTQATMQLQPAVASIRPDEPSLVVMVSAIDVDGMQIGRTLSASQFVVRWNNTDVPVSANLERKGMFVARIEKAHRQKPGMYTLEVELRNGLNESIGKTVKSCLLQTTTVAVLYAAEECQEGTFYDDGECNPCDHGTRTHAATHTSMHTGLHVQTHGHALTCAYVLAQLSLHMNITSTHSSRYYTEPSRAEPL